MFTILGTKKKVVNIEYKFWEEKKERRFLPAKIILTFLLNGLVIDHLRVKNA